MLRKVEEASEALRAAMELMDENGVDGGGERGAASSVKAVEEAMQAAAKHVARSESLAALVAEARAMLELARAAEAERARVAAEKAAAEAAAAAAVKAERARVAAE
jgi:hypothetical protein